MKHSVYFSIGNDIDFQLDFSICLRNNRTSFNVILKIFLLIFTLGIFLILCKQSHGNFSSTTTTFAQLPAYHEDVKEPTTTISVPPTSTNEIAYTNLSQISTSTARSITRLLRINQTETAPNEEATNDTTTPTDFNICSYSDEKNYLTETLTGDIIVTIISHQSEYATATIKFIVNRINEINLLAYNKTIGKLPTTLLYSNFPL